MGVKLGVTVAYHGEENAIDFASRVAAANRKRCREFLHEVGVSHRKLSNGTPDAIAAFAELAGVDPEVLERSSYVVFKDSGPPSGRKRGAVLGAATLDFEYLDRSSFTICPQCLFEDIASSSDIPAAAAVSRVQWAIRHYRTCVRHGVRLIRLATDRYAARHIRDFAGDVGEYWCPGGFEVVHRQPSRLEAFIQRATERSSPFTAWLSEASLTAVTAASELIGAMMQDGPDANIAAYDDARWHKAGGLGYSLIEEGPAAIAGWLESLQNRKYSRTFGPTFGPFYRWMKTTRDIGVGPFRDLLRTFILDHFPVAEGKAVLGEKAPPRRFYTIGTAVGRFGMGRTTVEWAIKAAGIPAVGHNATESLYDAGAVTDLLNSVREALFAPQARKLLEMPKRDFDAAINIGAIQPLFPGGNEPRFARADLEAFYSKLVSKSVEREVSSTELLPLTQVTGAFMNEALAQVLEGRLPILALDASEKRYGGLMVSRTDVERIFRMKVPSAWSCPP